METDTERRRDRSTIELSKFSTRSKAKSPPRLQIGRLNGSSASKRRQNHPLQRDADDLSLGKRLILCYLFFTYRRATLSAPLGALPTARISLYAHADRHGRLLFAHPAAGWEEERLIALDEGVLQQFARRCSHLLTFVQAFCNKSPKDVCRFHAVRNSFHSQRRNITKVSQSQQRERWHHLAYLIRPSRP